MSQYVVLYNALACNGQGEKSSHRLDSILSDADLRYVDITSVADYRTFFDSLPEDEQVILCGGDGTLNRFINDSANCSYKNEILYFAAGTGNDFLHDVGAEPGDRPVVMAPYFKDLPQVTVKGKTYRFLNNVGFGIDGYCTQVGDEMRAQHKENINYTGIAIKGLLGGFKPVNAKVTVDGVEHTYKKAWLAPTMNGRYYGGGMMPTPAQNRLNPEHTVSVMVFYGKGKLKTLMAFPSIFQGEHVKYTKMVEILVGHDIHVVFDRPCALQIDGETILDVTEYEVHTCKASAGVAPDAQEVNA